MKRPGMGCESCQCWVVENSTNKETQPMTEDAKQTELLEKILKQLETMTQEQKVQSKLLGQMMVALTNLKHR